MRHLNWIVLVVVILICVRPANSRLFSDQKKRVPPSGPSGCTYIPGSGGSGCPIMEMHFAGGGVRPATYSYSMNIFGVDTNQN